MASKAKRTTFAKLNRENAVRERRLHKQAKKEARKLEAATQSPATEVSDSNLSPELDSRPL